MVPKRCIECGKEFLDVSSLETHSACDRCLVVRWNLKKIVERDGVLQQVEYD